MFFAILSVPFSRGIFLIIVTCRDKSVAQLQLISDLCDLTVPTSGLGLLNLDDGIVGLAGTVSSLIGLYGVWQKTA
jgi:peroxin-11B